MPQETEQQRRNNDIEYGIHAKVAELCDTCGGFKYKCEQFGHIKLDEKCECPADYGVSFVTFSGKHLPRCPQYKEPK